MYATPIGLFAVLATLSPGLAQDGRVDEPIKFARDPHVSNDGRIAFSYHGDLWIVDADGSDPVHLTDHTARDTTPRFSPDGSSIAFTSNRMGNNDVWVISASGGEPRQLTFHTTNDTVQNWTPDGNAIIFSTSRGAMPWSSPLYAVWLDGRIPMPLEMGSGAAGMIKQDGSAMAFNRVAYRHPKKHYRGSAASNIWIKNLATDTFAQLTDPDLTDYKNNVNDAYPMWGADDKVYYMSERDDTFNIWRVDPADGNAEQVTTHRTDGVQLPSISPNGSTIAYSNEFEVWTLAVPDGSPTRVPIRLPVRNERNLVEYVSSDNAADAFAPSPKGNYVAVDYHGEIYQVPAVAGVGEARRVTASPARDRSQTYSPDGKYLAYLSDASGDDEIWLYELDTGAQRKLTTQPSKKTIRMWADDSESLLFVANNTIFSVDIDSGTTTRVAYNEAGGFQINQLSPDGKWLVLTHSDDYQNSEVYLYDIENQTEHNVTAHPARDADGQLTPDGKTLVFTSNRDGGTDHLFAVSLARITEDPNDPRVVERKANEEPARPRRGRRGQAEEEDPEQTEEAEATPFAIQMDLEGIDLRPVQLTSGSSGVSTFFLSENGETVYFVSGGNAGGGRRGGGRRGGGGNASTSTSALHSIGIDGEGRRQVAEGAFRGLVRSADGQTLFFREGGGGGGRRGGRGGGGGGGGDIYRMSLDDREKEQVTFAFSIEVDKRLEWQQMFDEFYRHWKYSYVEEDMHGYDWAAIRARYEPMIEAIGETQDFYDLAAEMLAELNCSHSGISLPPGTNQTEQTYQTRYLGIEMEPADGRYQVTHVYRTGPADKEWLDIDEGDYVLALDGVQLQAGDNYWKLLNKLLNEYVTVTVADSAEAGAETRDLRIQTVTSLRNIKYEEWIADNRDFVDQESNGQIIYMHIRSMNQASLEKFENEIDQFFYKKGAIIDVRYNGGGNIDQQLMDILERKPYQLTWSKTSSPVWGRRPKQTIVGPKVMMINWRSGSDAEMTPHGFRHLGLGRIVGTPTNGAVVSAGRYPLMDGGSTRIPGTRVVNYDPTQPFNWGFNLENYGVPPDVWARNSPEDELNGYPHELKQAVDEVQRMLEAGEGNWQFVAPDRRNGDRKDGGK